MPQSLRGLAPRQPRSPDLRVVRTFDATPDDGPTRTERPAEGRFAMVPDVVLATANAHAIAVYAILAKHANQDGYCWPSLPTIGTAVGLSKPTVEKAIALLVAAGAIRKERRYAHGMLQSNGYFLLYSAQYRQASTLPTQASTLPMVGNLLYSGRQGDCLELEPRELEPEEQETPPLPPKAPSPIEQRFIRWYTVYPKKKGKQAALKMWLRLKPDEAMTERLIAAVLTQRTWNDWTKSGGQFIPNPATWLSQGRWEDEDRAASANGHEGMSNAFATGRRVY